MLEETVMTVAEVMSRDVLTVKPEATLLEAARVMAKRDVSGLPVVDDDGHLVGIITEGDLVKWHQDYSEKESWWLAMLADGFELAPEFLEAVRAQHMKVRARMETKIITVAETTPLREVATLLGERAIKRVPVVREGKLVGIISRHDLIKAFVTHFERKT